MVWNAVPAFGRADDRAAPLHYFGGSGHSFYGLIEILIERIARICGDHNIEWFIHTAHRVLTRNTTCGGVLLKQVAGESCRDLLIAVECDIEGKIYTRQTGNL